MSVQEPRLNQFASVYSKKDSLPDDSRLVEKINEYDYVLQHRFSGVEVLDADGYAALPDDLLELRAFSATGELHLVCMDGKRYGRVRTDVMAEGPAASRLETFDEEHQVWGSEASLADGVITLREDRGTVVRLPESIASQLPDVLHIKKGNTTDDGGQRFFATIFVRNYLDEESVDAESGDTSFAFVDYRLMGFNVREVK